MDISEPANVIISLMNANQEYNNKKISVDKIIKMVPDLIKKPVHKLFEQFEINYC